MLSEGEVQQLLSVSDNLVVGGRLRLIPIPGHNDTALCDKPLKPMSETRSFCATLQFPPLLCHASPMKWRLNGYSPYCGEESSQYFISSFFQRDLNYHGCVLSVIIFYFSCATKQEVQLLLLLLLVLLIILLLYFLFYSIFSCQDCIHSLL